MNEPTWMKNEVARGMFDYLKSEHPDLEDWQLYEMVFSRLEPTKLEGE